MKAIFVTLTFFLLSAHAREVENMFEGQTSIKNPFKLRDPFQAPKFKSESNRISKQIKLGNFNNEKKVNFRYKLEEISIIGVLIGKKRRVIIKTGKGDQNSKNVYTLKEGEKLGLDGPEIKAILPGGIILVERITNIYGESEFIETVVPISK